MTIPLVRIYRNAGATLVELVVSIVVISIGLAGILSVMNRNLSSSGDPMVQHQAIAIGGMQGHCNKLPNMANYCDGIRRAASDRG